MEYSLKDKIEVTEEFLNDLITKNWQETEALQQQIANMDTSTRLGAEVAKILKNTCTNYYVLIGCLETLAENPNAEFEMQPQEAEQETANDIVITEPTINDVIEPEVTQVNNVETNTDFEPFEYFVDFDEPSGVPVTDQDLYG